MNFYCYSCTGCLIVFWNFVVYPCSCKINFFFHEEKLNIDFVKYVGPIRWTIYLGRDYVAFCFVIVAVGLIYPKKKRKEKKKKKKGKTKE